MSDRWERWREAMARSDGKGLIELHRNWLGEVSMPYRKHDIVAAIERFVRASGRVAAIERLMGTRERSLAGILALAGPCTLREASGLARLEPEVASDLLWNLVDRLVAYPLGSRPERWELAPWMDAATGLDLALSLRPGEGGDEGRRTGVAAGSPAGRACRDEDLVAFAAALMREPRALRRDLAPGVKGAALLARLVPGVLAHPSRIADWTRALAEAGALAFDERGVDVDPGALRLLLGAFAPKEEGSGSGPSPTSARKSGRDDAAGRGDASRALRFLVALDFSLRSTGDASPLEGPEGSALREEIARVFATLGATLDLLSSLEWPEGAPVALAREGLATAFRALDLAGRDADRGDALDPEDGIALADLAIRFGLVDVVAAASGEGTAALPRAPRSSPEAAAESRVGVDGSGTITVPPGTRADALARIATFARLESRDVAWTFRPDRDSSARAAASGFSAEESIAALEELSGRAVPETVAFVARDWEREFRAVRLVPGVVVAVAPERRQAFAAWASARPDGALERISDGVWLVPDRDALDGIVKAGFAPASATRSSALALDSGPRGGARNAAALAAAAACARQARKAEGRPRVARIVPEPPSAEEAASALDAVERAIEALGLPARERREYLDRAARGLVALPSQVAAMRVSLEGGEAGGLDFNAKVRLVERALESGGTLELVLSGRDGARSTLRVRPRSLSRAEGDVLVRGIEPGSGEELVLPLGSLATLRRVRTHVYGEKR